MNVVNRQVGGIFFLYGYGGTEKTFIWKTLACALCSKGDIVLTIASSGISSLLLPNDKTAHSKFVILVLNIIKTLSCCSIIILNWYKSRNDAIISFIDVLK